MKNTGRPYVAVTDKGKGLSLHMPNGTIVPGQVDLKLEQSLDEYTEGQARVTVSFVVDVRHPKMYARIEGKDLISLLTETAQK